METIIKIHPSELNTSLLKKIREFIGNEENVDVTISLKEFDPIFKNELNLSLQQAESGDVISLTMEEFIAYVPHKN